MKFAIALLSSFAIVAAAHAAECTSPDEALREATEIARKTDRSAFVGQVSDYTIGYVGPGERDGKSVQIVASTFDFWKAPDVTVRTVVLTELNADCSIASRTATETMRLNLD